MSEARPKQFVAVFDFGAQYGQLIARRVRDLHVYSEIVPCDISADELAAMGPSAIILSGGPASVYAEGAPDVDARVFDLGIPVLGFCYGEQIMAVKLGGEVAHTDKGEYGPAALTRLGSSVLLDGTPEGGQTVWMSHRDSVSRAPEGFMVTGRTDACPVAVMECPRRRLFATQFHPEVRHTEYGTRMLENFLFDVCRLEKSWTMGSIIDQKVEEIRRQVGSRKVILALSGGVDSSVVAALVHRAIGDQLTCVFVNHGMLRKGEPEMVEEIFREQFHMPLVHVHAEDRYARMLAGVTDPEKKRRLIGTEFWKAFFDEAQKIGDVEMLAQGTIYPDIIESGARKTGGKAATIKSHHNLIPFPEGVRFDLIEPLDHFFKDEVRELGIALGLPAKMVWRQPFPGPGLAIRVIGEVTPEKLAILKDADAIVREELDAYNQRLFEETGDRNSEHACWQYFAVLPDIRSVGVMGDERTYRRPVIVRAVESTDAMTADWAKLPYDVIGRISSRIVDEVDGVNRVVYDVTPKPPATIEWE
ncbi:MAG: glutamine-hydrolyzing GMP synthase [Coriobacteriaceae bacterium]|uniref:glutamine-hydrolyzing GMP synthase n=1 Tax=Tractidigestivibacter sp. TaxID=2847320 RepID=UPI002A8206E3|nr:glutamine-hydrolyzing GMP synthase [Tractidigestivibacter sp.]MCI6273118.1 glutamine-hydrolyzing GMP synthase [Coriobacteriaceae bacterium]MCI6548270.1 glutamine-hydrolyzing GMP synthase [Coriobacteriaceae bacterium]MCI6844960.1 glutamine-hydrolyzing GMP synthase [Coriobacteriaceae bacterium]MDD7584973.1 glutamine-hydrolyzing GMP synthase [Coriobacteriaceae bacterium]MDY4535200.1 glutamine-hydrolyzing GMP synthase [Tractidigestivibacter sp.]